MPKCHIWAQAVTKKTYYIKWLQIGRFWYEGVRHVKCTMMKDSLKRRNKMPTRCSRGFYCRSYCLLNMFRAPLCPSSGAQGYYTVFAACGISCWGFQFAVLVWSWGLCVRFAGCCFTANWKPQHEIPQAATTELYSWAPDDGHSGARNMLSKQ